LNDFLGWWRSLPHIEVRAAFFFGTNRSSRQSSPQLSEEIVAGEAAEAT